MKNIRVYLMNRANQLHKLVVSRLNQFFNKAYAEILLKNSFDEEFTNLAPIIDIEEVDKSKTYTKALTYALNNDHVNNIAIAGPYGSGKSSLIMSYFKHVGVSAKEYLVITLTTFINKENYYPNKHNDITKDSKEDFNQNDNDKSRGYSHQPINELEATILEQILYSNEEKSHKYSSLKRINVPRLRTATTKFVMLFIFIVSLLTFINSQINIKTIELINVFLGFFNVQFTGFYDTKQSFFTVLFFILININNIIVLFNIYRLIFALSKISFSIFKFNFEMKSSNGESLLDKYIDEIYNFFKHNNYKYIVFEDLDRYQNTDIFERLKRINRLINSENNKKNKVKFIYTIGDHMFEDDQYKERTKFFDFLLPIIPIIDSMNSYSDLKIRFNDLQISHPIIERLLKDVSYYIDDMRTLKNISNEFLTYHHIISDPDDINFSNKLFAIICYKNQYPNDFSKFQYRTGFLADFINSSNEIRRSSVLLIEEKISKLETRINNYLSEPLSSIVELIDIFRMYLIRKMGTGSLSIYDKITGSNKNTFNKETILNIGLDDIFVDQTIIINGVKIDEMELRTLDYTSLDIFERIELVNIKEKKNLNNLKNELSELYSSRDKIQYSNLATIIEKNINVEVVFEFRSNYPLLFYFIVNSYIDNEYYKYLGHFKAGHITSNDKKFLALIKSKLDLDPDFPIETAEMIVNELVVEDLHVDMIFNYSLIHYLLINNDFNRLNLIVKFHTEKLDKILHFISGYLNWSIGVADKQESCKAFVIFIYNSHFGVGKFIIENELSVNNYDDKVIDYVTATLFDSLIKDSDNPNNVSLMEYIINHNNLLKLLSSSSKDMSLKIVQLINKKGLKIQKIEFMNLLSFNDDESVRYIYNNDLYAFNYLNINIIIRILLEYHENTVKATEFLEYISNSDTKIRTYIEMHGSYFIDKILSRFDDYSKISSKQLIYCINNLCYSNDDVKRLFELTESSTLVEDLSTIKTEFYTIAINESRLKANYGNIFKYVNAIGVDNNLKDYLQLKYLEIQKDSVVFSTENRTALISLICSLNNDDALSNLAITFADIELTVAEFDIESTKVNRFIELGFNFKIDLELIELATEDQSLMTQIIINLSDKIIKSDLDITIDFENLREAYSKISFINFKQILQNQIIGLENNIAISYVSEVIDLFTNEEFIQFISEEKVKETKMLYVIIYIKTRVVDRIFLTHVMPIIDKKYVKFMTEDRITIIGGPDIENLLLEFKNIGLLSYKKLKNNKLLIYVLKNRTILKSKK